MKKVLRVGLLLFVFAALPLGLMELGISIVGETSRARVFEETRLGHEKVLAQMSLVDDEPFFASRVVKRLYQRFTKQGLRKGLRDLRNVDRVMSGALELYFFDGSGKLIPAISARERGRNFIERCYQVIGTINRGEQPPPGQLGMLRELWKMPRVETLRNYGNGRPMPIGQDPSAGYSCFH